MRQCQRLTIWSDCPEHAKEKTDRRDPLLTIFVPGDPLMSTQKSGTHGWPNGDPGLTFEQTWNSLNIPFPYDWFSSCIVHTETRLRLPHIQPVRLCFLLNGQDIKHTWWCFYYVPKGALVVLLLFCSGAQLLLLVNHSQCPSTQMSCTDVTCPNPSTRLWVKPACASRPPHPMFPNLEFALL